MRSWKRLLLAGVCVFVAQGAAADPAYRADDIVKHFAPAPDLGQTRGLCIGTEAECAKSTAPRKVTTGASFDLVVQFEYNSDKLTPAARANLAEFGKALKDDRLVSSSFVVEGHTDAKGGERYNLDLSQRRANAVVAFLREQGVDTGRLAPKGFGKMKPRSPDPLDPANRRVETRLNLQ